MTLKVIHRRRRTGFEETKDFPIRVSDLIAGRYQARACAMAILGRLSVSVADGPCPSLYGLHLFTSGSAARF